jgi:hypothetical protein
VGLALGSIPVLTELALIAREFAPELVLRPLRFFPDSPHGPEPDATGCELSTIDSAFLFARMLACAAYFDADTEEEREIRRLVGELARSRLADLPAAAGGLHCVLLDVPVEGDLRS